MMGGYGGYGSGYGGMMGGYGFGWIGMVVELVFFLAILAGVVLVVMWAIRSFGGGGGAAGPAVDDRAMQIAKERFAKGEITKDEYQEIIKHLGSS